MLYLLLGDVDWFLCCFAITIHLILCEPPEGPDWDPQGTKRTLRSVSAEHPSEEFRNLFSESMSPDPKGTCGRWVWFPLSSPSQSQDRKNCLHEPHKCNHDKSWWLPLTMLPWRPILSTMGNSFWRDLRKHQHSVGVICFRSLWEEVVS